MKINVISDLHIDFSDVTLPGGDVLVLSGDICEARRVKRDSPDHYYRFFEEECSKYRETVMVMGNHEHYGFQYHKTYLHLQENLPDHVTLLENQTHTIDDVVFVGSSLWTDMNRGDPLTEWHCGRNMNDYRSITMFNQVKSAYHRLTVERTVADHHASRQFIKDTVEADASKQYVVVTHHAPSFASVAEQYQTDTLMNGAYASDLTEFILDHPQIRLWTHGHMHNLSDYMIGSTRVVCNPRGYDGYETRADLFQADAAVIEL
jgi:Icc-related predicted phosphoesterase